LDDSTFQLFRPSPPAIDNEFENFVVLDRFDNTIKEFNIKTGKIQRKIIADSNFDNLFLIDTLNNYEIIKSYGKSLTQFSVPKYGIGNHIIVNANVLVDFKRDTIVNNFKSKDSITIRISNIMKSLTLKFTDNQHFNLINLNDSIFIFGLHKTLDGMLSTIKYKKNLSFEELNEGNYFIISLFDTINFNIKENYLKYKDVINYYDLKNYVGSSGLLAEANKKYVYLNPWNGIFCKFKYTIEDSISIKGYLEKVKLKDQPFYPLSSILEPSEISRYSINSLHSYKNKAIVYLQAIKGNRLTPFTVIQVYDIDKGFEKEIILNSSSNQYYYSYLLKIDEQYIYILNQNELEDWSISKIPIKEIL